MKTALRMPASRRFRPARLAVAVAMALAPLGAKAVTYTVTTANQFGAGSLDAAIQAANANCLSDPNPVINFNVGTGPIVITTSAFFTEVVGENCGSPYFPIIDGTTQPGYVPNTDATGSNAVFGVVLDGNGTAFTPFNFITNGVLTIRGLEIRNFSAAAVSNTLFGAIAVFGSSIHNNLRAIDYNGPNTVTVGSAALADRNYIYSNSVVGISSINAASTTITNSFIGTNPSASAAAPNGVGIAVQGTLANIVGNIVSGNSFNGIQALGTSSGSTISNNKIGTNLVGGIIPNATGIRAEATSVPLNITNNTIRGNSQYGIMVASGDHVSITDNSIFGNALKNVTLDMYGGPVPNDAQDVDPGPNNRQNFPVVTAVTNAPGPSINVTFTFNSNPGESYTLDFYSNSVAVTPAGETFLGSFSATTNAAGDMVETGTITFPGALTNISAVARRSANGDTSEFSPAVTASGAPSVTVAPAALNFPNVVVGTSSASQVATVTSTGTSAYQISQLSTGSCYGGPICYGGAEFTCSTTCATFTPYAPGTSCTVSATFNPTAPGPQSTSVAICDNAVGSPRLITITGTGVISTLAVTPPSFDFGNAPVNGRSPTAFFRVQNPSPSPARYTAATNGPFQIVGTTCRDPIPGNGACDFEVAFAPRAAGLANGNLAISSGGAVNQSLLQGNGVVAPLLTLPSNVDITYTLGSAPGQARVTLANAGTARLDFTSISISGLPFTLVNNCPASLPPGSTCDLIVGFSQAVRGEVNGTLTIVSNAPGGSAVIRLRGIASPREVAVLEVTPREIGYGNVAFGKESAGELVKVHNIGGSPAAFDSFVVSPDFVILSNGCAGSQLAPEATCELRVAARPLSYGVRFGKFTVRSNAENGPVSIDLFGSGCRGAALTVPRLGTAGNC